MKAVSPARVHLRALRYGGQVWLLIFAATCCLAGRAPWAGQATDRQTPLSVDDIIAKNLTAKGGLETLKAIMTMKQTATVTFQGQASETTIWSKRPYYVRQEVTMGGQKVINGFDGQTPWIVNPLTGGPSGGNTRPIMIQGPQADMIRDQSSFDGPLVDYKFRGITVVLDGFESAPGEGTAGRLLINLRLTRGQQVSHLYLDGTTYLEVRLSTMTERTRLDQEFSDYRVVKGIKVPFLIRTLANGVLQSEMKVKSVEFDVPMDDAMFRVPKG
jgi:hypothetical protein